MKWRELATEYLGWCRIHDAPGREPEAQFALVQAKERLIKHVGRASGAKAQPFMSGVYGRPEGRPFQSTRLNQSFPK
jgi:hypothetical protein